MRLFCRYGVVFRWASARMTRHDGREAYEGLLVLSRCKTATADTDLRWFAEHGKTLYFFFASRPTARPCAVGYAPHRCPSGPRLDPEMGHRSTAMNLTVMSEHRWALAGMRGGKLAVPQLAQQRKDQYIPSESLVMTALVWAGHARIRAGRTDSSNSVPQGVRGREISRYG